MGDVLFPVQPADNNVIRAWDANALPKPVAPKSVSVVSITGSYDAALAAGQALASRGPQSERARPPEPCPSNVSETLVLYHPRTVAQALDVMKYLSGAVMMQVDPVRRARDGRGRPRLHRQRGGQAVPHHDYSRGHDDHGPASTTVGHDDHGHHDHVPGYDHVGSSTTTGAHASRLPGRPAHHHGADATASR